MQWLRTGDQSPGLGQEGPGQGAEHELDEENYDIDDVYGGDDKGHFHDDHDLNPGFPPKVFHLLCLSEAVVDGGGALCC